MADRRETQALLRARVEYWTGLKPQDYAALPPAWRARIRIAIAEYYAELAEERSPHGGMFDAIAAVYGGLPWMDWAVDVRGCDDDGY